MIKYIALPEKQFKQPFLAILHEKITLNRLIKLQHKVSQCPCDCHHCENLLNRFTELVIYSSTKYNYPKFKTSIFSAN